jgi:hypothetical protein
MVKDSTSRRPGAVLVLGLTALLVAGCSAPGTYPAENGPRNGAGFLVDPRTGMELPGQGNPGK